MAGFGAAYRLHSEGITPVMYDKNAYYGGHTASFRYETGFLFDVGPHISFTKDTRIQEVFADSVEQQYETIQINLNNYLARTLAAAPGATSSARNARRPDRQGHQ
jgi:protoporphyrinogen oxidase